MSYLRSIGATFVVTSMIAVPVITFAQTVTTSAQTLSVLQQQLQSLLAEIAQLQQTATTSAPAVTTPASSSAPASSNIICPTLVRTLALGSSGTDVANLQGFLAQNPLIYPEQSVTGYFGMYTQDAVERWQTAYGVISSGTPESSGYGVVGPHTRAAMLASCANSTNSSGGQSTIFSGSNANSQPLCPVAPQPAIACAGTWSPLTNTAGCTIAWQCSVPLADLATSSAITSTGPTLTASIGPNSPYIVSFNGSNFLTGLYTIDFGDGIARTQTVTAVCSTASASQSSSCGTFNASHTYPTGGTYLAAIVSSSGTTIASTYVYIEAPIVSSSYYSSDYQVSFSASGAPSGPPTPVTFTIANVPDPAANYVINFGDGSLGSAWSASGSSGTYVQSHTYASAGTYMAYLLDSSGTTVATITITISQTNSSAPTISSITPVSGPNGTLVTIAGTGFTQGISRCGQACGGGGTTGGSGIYVDGRVVSPNAYVGPTTLAFHIGVDDSGNGTPGINDPLTVGTHQIYVTNPNGTSNTITFKVTR